MKVLISINDNLKDMLSGKLPYNMKKPNEHHKYWRYVLSTGSRTEISTKTKVKYETYYEKTGF